MLYKQNTIYNQVGNGGGGGEIVNPIITDGYSVQTLVEGHCDNHYTIPNANNQGSICMTLKTVPIGFKLRRLGVHIIQGVGTSGFKLFCMDKTGKTLARTQSFAIALTSDLGERFFPINEIWNGEFNEVGNEITLEGGKAYYFGIYCPQVASSARFIGDQCPTFFGVKPWISWTADNIGVSSLNQMPPGFETSTRILVYGAT
jgi:hypothetical protein